MNTIIAVVLLSFFSVLYSNAQSLISSFQDFATLNAPADTGVLDQSGFPVDGAFPQTDAFPSAEMISQQSTGSMGTASDSGFPMSSADIASQLGLDSTMGMGSGTTGSSMENPMINNNFLPDIPRGGQFVDLISGITKSFSTDVFGGGQVDVGTAGQDVTSTGVDTGTGSVMGTGALDQSGLDQQLSSGFDMFTNTDTTAMGGLTSEHQTGSTAVGAPVNVFPVSGSTDVPATSFDVSVPNVQGSGIPVEAGLDTGPGGISPDQALLTDFSTGVLIGSPGPGGPLTGPLPPVGEALAAGPDTSNDQLQMSDSYTLMARTNIGNFNRNRDLTKKLRQMRKDARQQWKQQKQERKQFNAQNKAADTVGKVKIKPDTRVSIAKMVRPGQKTPFVGKNQRGRRTKPPCTNRRQRLGLCTPDPAVGGGKGSQVKASAPKLVQTGFNRPVIGNRPLFTSLMGNNLIGRAQGLSVISALVTPAGRGMGPPSSGPPGFGMGPPGKGPAGIGPPGMGPARVGPLGFGMGPGLGGPGLGLGRGPAGIRPGLGLGIIAGMGPPGIGLNQGGGGGPGLGMGLSPVVNPGPGQGLKIDLPAATSGGQGKNNKANKANKNNANNGGNANKNKAKNGGKANKNKAKNGKNANKNKANKNGGNVNKNGKAKNKQNKANKGPKVLGSSELVPVDVSTLEAKSTNQASSKVAAKDPTSNVNTEHIPGFGFIDWGTQAPVPVAEAATP